MHPFSVSFSSVFVHRGPCASAQVTLTPVPLEHLPPSNLGKPRGCGLGLGRECLPIRRLDGPGRWRGFVHGHFEVLSLQMRHCCKWQVILIPYPHLPEQHHPKFRGRPLSSFCHSRPPVRHTTSLSSNPATGASSSDGTTV